MKKQRLGCAHDHKVYYWTLYAKPLTLGLATIRSTQAMANSFVMHMLWPAYCNGRFLCHAFFVMHPALVELPL